MDTTDIDILCYRNAQRGPNLYQAEQGGRIRIMFTQEESNERRKTHLHTHHDEKGADEGTRHEHPQGGEPGGSHIHDTHGHTHGGATHADHGEAAEHHHEKGGHTADHDLSGHNPA